MNFKTTAQTISVNYGQTTIPVNRMIWQHW